MRRTGCFGCSDEFVGARAVGLFAEFGRKRGGFGQGRTEANGKSDVGDNGKPTQKRAYQGMFESIPFDGRCTDVDAVAELCCLSLGLFAKRTVGKDPIGPWIDHDQQADALVLGKCCPHPR